MRTCGFLSGRKGWWLLLGLGLGVWNGEVGAQWKTFTTADGLGNNFVGPIFQSSDGAMWFGTVAGVSRYDGSSWQSFTVNDGLPSNIVRFIRQSSDRAMWFAMDWGITVFRRPVHSYAQTQLLRSPPALLGDSRFFFKFQGYEIASDRQPPISFAITRAEDSPENSEWKH